MVSNQWAVRNRKLDRTARENALETCRSAGRRRRYPTLYLHKGGEVEVSDKKKDKDKKKKKKSVMEAEIMRFMEKSMKTALDLALDDIFKDWK